MNNFSHNYQSFKHENCQGGLKEGTGESRDMWRKYGKASTSETAGEGSFVCAYQRRR